MSLKSVLKGSQSITLTEGNDVVAYGLRIRKIAELVRDYPQIANVWNARDGKDRVSAIVNATVECGPDVVDALINAITRSKLSEEDFDNLLLIDEIEILAAGIRLSMPEQRVGKLTAEGEKYLKVVGK